MALFLTRTPMYFWWRSIQAFGSYRVWQWCWMTTHKSMAELKLSVENSLVLRSFNEPRWPSAWGVKVEHRKFEHSSDSCRQLRVLWQTQWYNVCFWRYFELTNFLEKANARCMLFTAARAEKPLPQAWKWLVGGCKCKEWQLHRPASHLGANIGHC